MTSVTPGPMLVSRVAHPADTRVRIGEAEIGGPRFAVIAGPCAVEGRRQLELTARGVRAAGATVLRAGVYKLRTSPYAFQGLGRDALALLSDVARGLGLPVVTEIADTRELDALCEHVDCLQVGARNMDNPELLKALAGCGKPVLLKRGMAATVGELLHAAEYLLYGGNDAVVLCERGIRTFETAMRNTLDLAAVAWLKRESHLPVLVDPSHATGRPDLVAPMACAAAAAGADGLLIEVHCAPSEALSDGEQALDLPAFDALMRRLAPFVGAAGRTL